MLPYHTAMLQVEVAVHAIALQIRINSDITQKLHHEHKMKIGIAMLYGIEEYKGAVEKIEKRLILALFPKSIRKELGKIQRY